MEEGTKAYEGRNEGRHVKDGRMVREERDMKERRKAYDGRNEGRHVKEGRKDSEGGKGYEGTKEGM